MLVTESGMVTDCKEQQSSNKGGKTKCDERKDDGNVGKELMERELGEIEGAEGCHNQM